MTRGCIQVIRRVRTLIKYLNNAIKAAACCTTQAKHRPVKDAMALIERSPQDSHGLKKITLQAGCLNSELYCPQIGQKTFDRCPSLLNNCFLLSFKHEHKDRSCDHMRSWLSVCAGKRSDMVLAFSLIDSHQLLYISPVCIRWIPLIRSLGFNTRINLHSHQSLITLRLLFLHELPVSFTTGEPSSPVTLLEDIIIKHLFCCRAPNLLGVCVVMQPADLCS